MPVIGIPVKHLSQLLGKTLSQEELADAVEQLGCDLEEVGKSNYYECPQCQSIIEKLEHEPPPRRCSFCGKESEEDFLFKESDEVIRLDLLPARPDLFDAAGLSRALKGFLNIETGLWKPVVGPAEITVDVSDEMQGPQIYRPFIACAVVEMPPVDSDILRALMKLQENLHWGIGRDRKLASIGVYNLDTIKPPIHYRAVGPEELTFCPLGNPGQQMTPAQILKEHPKGVAYAHLLKDCGKYPLLIDDAGQVLSMPPIINSDETRIKIGSTRMFIDTTGTTERDAHKSLNTLVCSLIEMGGKVTAVKVISSEKTIHTPNLSTGAIPVNIESARRWLGVDFKIPDFIKYLERMRLQISGRFPKYNVKYPAYRTDIKHEVDIFEDLAIAYGYTNFPDQLVQTMTIGQARPEEKISEVMRDIMLGLGFNEVMSLMLTTEANHFTKLKLPPRISML